VELQPKEAVFRGTLALLLLEQGDNRRAVNTLKPLLNQSEIDPGLQYRFARLLVQAGDAATARDGLERLLEAVPAFPERVQAFELLQALGGSRERPMTEQAFDP
jgi:predicted Zn-dependent protease